MNPAKQPAPVATGNMRAPKKEYYFNTPRGSNVADCILNNADSGANNRINVYIGSYSHSS